MSVQRGPAVWRSIFVVCTVACASCSSSEPPGPAAETPGAGGSISSGSGGKSGAGGGAPSGAGPSTSSGGSAQSSTGGSGGQDSNSNASGGATGPDVTDLLADFTVYWDFETTNGSQIPARFGTPALTLKGAVLSSGPTGQALSLSGTNSSAEAATVPIDTSGDFSIAAW